MASFKLSPRGRALSVWALYAVGLVPGLWGFYQGATGQLIGDPVRIFEHMLGLWALRFLCLGLAVTPVRDLFGLNLLAYRRALGLLRASAFRRLSHARPRPDVLDHCR